MLDRMSKMGLPYFIYSETVRAMIRHDGESRPRGLLCRRRGWDTRAVLAGEMKVWTCREPSYTGQDLSRFVRLRILGLLHWSTGTYVHDE